LTPAAPASTLSTFPHSIEPQRAVWTPFIGREAIARGGKRMNAGRFVGASVVVFIVRTVMNTLFYGFLMRGEYAALAAAHPGVFREVVPAFIAIDLVVAFLLTYLIVRAGSAFGGGMKGAVTLAVLLAIFGPVIFGLYYFFSVTYESAGSFALESVYQIVAHAIQGAVAAAIYKNV
jgi:hypothetical protein